MEIKQICTILDHRYVNANTLHMTLSADTSMITAPGQFVHIALDDLYLRRPISIASWTKDTLELYYRVVGHGTENMSYYPVGKKLDCLLPLGNGFSVKENEKPLLIGGGIGTPPLLGLAKAYVQKGVIPCVALGFNTKEEIILEDAFLSLGCEVRTATVDGSYGIKGFVTNLFSLFINKPTYFHACGPEQMLKAVCTQLEISGECSFEERMACGIGACMGCSCQTKYGNKRICKDGPVLTKEEIIW